MCFVRECLSSQLSDTVQFGESWLFYGCRHKEQDYLYRLVVDLAKVNRTLFLKALSGPSADQVNLEIGC